jgi:hypothetical protein
MGAKLRKLAIALCFGTLVLVAAASYYLTKGLGSGGSGGSGGGNSSPASSSSALRAKKSK